MDANEKELKSILVESTPILFLGAGFSIDSKNFLYYTIHRQPQRGDYPCGGGYRCILTSEQF